MNKETFDSMRHEIASLADNSMFDAKVHPDEAYKVAINDVLEILDKYTSRKDKE